MNKRLLTCLFSLSMLSVISTVQAEEVYSLASARVVKVDGYPLDKPLVPKQTVLLNVDAMVTTWFTAPPVYPQWQMPGAVIIDSAAQNLALQQRIKGKTYAGVRREFLLIPQKTGTLRLPRSEIILTPALSDDKRSVVVSAAPFEVKMPAGAGDLTSFLPASRLTLKETFEPVSLEGLKVGDAVTRKVTVEVDGTLASFIPAIDAGTLPEGMELYTDNPQVVAVTSDRGDFIGGKRIETFSYLAYDEGSYTLPGIKLRWWNTEKDRFESAQLAPVTIPIAAAPDAGAEAELQRGLGARVLDNLGFILLTMIIAVFVLMLMLRSHREIVRFVYRLRTTVGTKTKRLITSEPVCFYRMLIAIRFSSHRRAIHLYHLWLCARGSMAETLSLEIATWLSKRYGNKYQDISGKDVVESLKKTRAHYKQNLQPKHHRYSLPALNR